jgi:hypothetical protein
MNIDELTEQHLGNSADENDLADFKTACRNYHTKWNTYHKQIDRITEEQAIDYIWNNGNFMGRMTYWKSVK